MRWRAAAVGAAGVLVAVLLAAADLLQGQGGMSAHAVWHALIERPDTLEGALVWDVRLPRAAAGAVAGASLAAATVLLQAVTRNPLAEPATLGLTAGGALAVTVVAGFAGLGSAAPTIAVAFVGVLGASVLIGLLSALAGAGTLRLVLVGMAVGLALSAATAAVQLAREVETSALFLWGGGSLLQLGWEQVRIGAAVGAAALAAALLVTRSLDVGTLGREAATALGGRPARVRAIAIALAALLAAVSVGVAGPIAFVGILSVGIARLARPRGTLGLLLVALAWGAATVLGGDVAARALMGVDTETPAGVVCALIGAPALVVVALRLREREATLVDGAASAARWRPGATALLVLALPPLALAALCLGDVRVAPGEMLGAVFGAGTPLGEIALDERAPRLAVALVAGACLAASGTVLQGAIRNPFAGPELIGVTGGASVAALLVVLRAPQAPQWILPMAAFAGGLLAAVVVLAIAGARGASPPRLALVGLAVAAAATAVTTLLVLRSQTAAASAITWLAGSTYASGWEDLRLVAAPALVLIPLALLAIRRLDVLGLHDELATSLGLGVGRARVLLVALGAALAASAVAAVGAIAFVGLLAPHAARMLAGGNHARALPVAMGIGALLLAAADVIGRAVIPPQEIPAGLVVSLIGAAYLAVIMGRRRALV